MSSQAINVLDRPPDCTVRVPGSKSHTNRALVCAALASGTSTLDGVSADMEATLARDTPRAIALIDQHIRATAEVILGELRPREPDAPAR